MQIKNTEFIKKTIPRIVIQNWTFAFYLMEIKRPSVILRNRYDERKKEFVGKLEASTLGEINRVNSEAYRDENKSKSDDEIATEIYDDVVPKITRERSGKPKVSSYIIKSLAEVSEDRARAIKDIILERYNNENENPIYTPEPSPRRIRPITD
jgi:hypothetical protein